MFNMGVGNVSKKEGLAKKGWKGGTVTFKETMDRMQLSTSRN